MRCNRQKFFYEISRDLSVHLSRRGSWELLTANTAFVLTRRRFVCLRLLIYDRTAAVFERPKR